MHYKLCSVSKIYGRNIYCPNAEAQCLFILLLYNSIQNISDIIIFYPTESLIYICIQLTPLIRLALGPETSLITPNRQIDERNENVKNK